MGRPVTFVRMDIAKFLLRVMQTPYENRANWVTKLCESLAEGKRGNHPFADELFDEVDEFREIDRNRKAKSSKDSTESKDSRVSHTSQSVSQSVNTEDNRESFDFARRQYPGTKRGFKPEWENFIKKQGPNVPEVLELLLPAINAEKQHRANLIRSGSFCPDWKNFQTWINGECWTQEFSTAQNVNGRPVLMETSEEKSQRRFRETHI